MMESITLNVVLKPLTYLEVIEKILKSIENNQDILGMKNQELKKNLFEIFQFVKSKNMNIKTSYVQRMCKIYFK